jgi:hypothetical protein
MFAQQETSGLRFSVAENPSTPPEVLAILAQDGNDNVRNAANNNFAERESSSQ